MKLYRVAVCASPFGEGTCGAPGCSEWGNLELTFGDAAAFACDIGHAPDAAARLVMAEIRRDVRYFRVQTYEPRFEAVSPIIGTSTILRNELCTANREPAV